MKSPTACRAKLRPEGRGVEARSPADDRAKKGPHAPTSLPAAPRTLAPRLPWVPFSDLAGALRQDD